MSLWVVRAGKYGEQEDAAVKEHLVCHAWNELPDYSAYRTKDDLRALYKKTYPRESEKQVISRLGQIWRFAHEIQKSDLVALPLKTESAFAFGRIVGEYQYEKVAPNVMHLRRVEWLKTVPRSVFPEDILHSMNSALTVSSASISASASSVATSETKGAKARILFTRFSASLRQTLNTPNSLQRQFCLDLVVKPLIAL